MRGGDHGARAGGCKGRVKAEKKVWRGAGGHCEGGGSREQSGRGTYRGSSGGTGSGIPEQHRERTYDLGFSMANRFTEEPGDLLEQFRQFETNVEAFEKSPYDKLLLF